MILQSCSALGADINKNGCYLMSILFLACQKIGRNFECEDILRLRDESISNGYIRKNCYVLKPDGIFELAGLRTQYTNQHERPGRKARPNEIEILYFRWGEYGHFIAGASGVVAYDPLGASNSVKYGTLRSKRIFKVV